MLGDKIFELAPRGIPNEFGSCAQAEMLVYTVLHHTAMTQSPNDVW